MPPDALLARLPEFLVTNIRDPAVAASTRDRVDRCLTDWPPSAGPAILAYLNTLGEAPQLYHAEPHCRQVSRVWSLDVLPDPVLEGVAHLRAALEAGPTVVLCNHLSYVDTTAADHVLAAHGHADLADRLATVAGPKVYADLLRRFAAAGLNTLPAPQSTRLEHTAHLGPRELARLARASVEAGNEALQAGFALQLYPEGSRTRTGHLGPFLRGVHRYLATPGLRIVPAAIAGTQHVFPVDATHIVPGPVRLAFGPPLDVASLGGPKDALAAVHGAVASLLPPALKPAPDTPPIR